jgi:hypothetical protein
MVWDGGSSGGGVTEQQGSGRRFDPRTLLPGMKNRAIGAAKSKLDPRNPDNRDCLSLFNTNGKGVAALELLQGLDGGNTDFGLISYGRILQPTISATTERLINPPGATIDFGAGITINDSVGSNWFLGDDVDRTVTILHELAHAYDVIWGVGASGLEDESAAKTEAEKIAISQRNSQKVKEKCFK